MNIDETYGTKYRECLDKIRSCLKENSFLINISEKNHQLDFDSEKVWVTLGRLHFFDDTNARLEITEKFPWSDKAQGTLHILTLNSIFEEWYKSYTEPSYQKFYLYAQTAHKTMMLKLAKVNERLTAEEKPYSLKYKATDMIFQIPMVDICQLICEKKKYFSFVKEKNLKDAFEIENFDLAVRDGMITPEDIDEICGELVKVIETMTNHIAKRRLYCIEGNTSRFIIQYLKDISIKTLSEQFGFTVVPGFTL